MRQLRSCSQSTLCEPSLVLTLFFACFSIVVARIAHFFEGVLEWLPVHPWLVNSCFLFYYRFRESYSWRQFVTVIVDTTISHQACQSIVMIDL